MRRSKAPSALNKPKRVCPLSERHPDSEIELHGSDPEDESFKWGSKDNPEAAEKEYLGKNKRIFNIVWRDVTTKKHKTWKGDGILEVNTVSMKAVAKDEAGKYLGCTTKFQLKDLQEEYQMLIGSKEIEIQTEIKDEEEMYELRKRQVKDRNWGEEEWVSPEMRAQEDNKPKGGFKFKPVLVLKQPQTPQSTETTNNWQQNQRIIPDSNISFPPSNRDNIPSGSKKNNEYEWGSHNNATQMGHGNTRNEMKKCPNVNTEGLNLTASTTLSNSFKIQSFMCFLKPSELQQYLFQIIHEYCTSNIKDDNYAAIDLPNVLQHICNHPSFIKHSASTNCLVQQLTAFLPHWSEMGPFDSGKLEFVQYFLQSLSAKTKHQNIIIIAHNINALNMLQGLCDFMNINCLRLSDTDSRDTKAHILQDFNTNELVVLLTNSIENIKNNNVFFNNRKIIVFENVHSNMNEFHRISKFNLTTVYYLVTSFSIEELLILPSIQNNLKLLNYKELLNLYKMEDTFCYAHTKIKCNCCNAENIRNDVVSSEDFTYYKNWRHLSAPFGHNFLKAGNLENSSENLVTIFCKTESYDIS